MKKVIGAIVVGILITVIGVSAGVIITYTLNKTVTQSSIIGSTVQYNEGIIVTLNTADTNTLTYMDADETETSKHYLTYIYDYQVLVDGLDIVVSSIGDDIVITGIESTDTTVAITFMLNQVIDWNEGDMVNIQFYFEAVERVVEVLEPLGLFTVDNPLDMNNTSLAELESVGFSGLEALGISKIYSHTNLQDVQDVTSSTDIIERYQEYVDAGIIVFN